MNTLLKSLLLTIFAINLTLPAQAEAVNQEKPLGFAPKKTSHHLVIYFHALGGAPQEPFVEPIKGAAIVDAVKSAYPGAGFLSIDYNPAQVLAGNFSTIDDTISAYTKDFPNVKSISLCGSSFGGYTALSYYTKASADVQSLVKGVVVSGVPDDLNLLSKCSKNKEVREFLLHELTVSKKPSYLKDRSLSQIYKSLKRPTNVYLILMKKDITVPLACNKDLEDNLKAKGCKVSIEKIDEGHGFPSIYFLEHGFHFISNDVKTLN
ncbi:hypothetical protein KA183_14025 [bacterium]|nr:hypothetical protein [bacterium]